MGGGAASLFPPPLYALFSLNYMVSPFQKDILKLIIQLAEVTGVAPVTNSHSRLLPALGLKL